MRTSNLRGLSLERQPRMRGVRGLDPLPTLRQRPMDGGGRGGEGLCRCLNPHQPTNAFIFILAQSQQRQQMNYDTPTRGRPDAAIGSGIAIITSFTPQPARSTAHLPLSWVSNMGRHPARILPARGAARTAPGAAAVA
jgi:hypothetical protein